LRCKKHCDAAKALRLALLLAQLAAAAEAGFAAAPSDEPFRGRSPDPASLLKACPVMAAWLSATVAAAMRR